MRLAQVRIERNNNHGNPMHAHAAVWSVAWNPGADEGHDVLCVADWGQNLSFYSLAGWRAATVYVLRS